MRPNVVHVAEPLTMAEVAVLGAYAKNNVPEEGGMTAAHRLEWTRTTQALVARGALLRIRDKKGRGARVLVSPEGLAAFLDEEGLAATT